MDDSAPATPSERGRVSGRRRRRLKLGRHGGRQPNRLGESLTRRQKRVFAAAGAALVVLLGGVGVWAATDPGSYGRSGNGCVNVVVPSTTGGAILH